MESSDGDFCRIGRWRQTHELCRILGDGASPAAEVAGEAVVLPTQRPSQLLIEQ
jgi:hypothetical protein